MPPVVRFAPSPTGFLHIGGVHTALFNWLFARHEGGEFRLRIENTDTSREVVEAVQQIQDSLSWLGLDWDGEVTFQLDRMEHCRQEAERLVNEGKAYEDEGAIRMRMPDEGVTGWDDLIRGRIEYPSEKLEDVVIVRADGRPTYNFASPVEDWLDDITLSCAATTTFRTRRSRSASWKRSALLCPRTATSPASSARTARSSPSATVRSRSRNIGARVPAGGYRQPLAILGWGYDDKTTIMSRDELIERFTLERVGSSPATFDYKKLDWLNGVYLRALSPEEYADTLLAYLREQGLEWDEALVRATAPLVQEKIAKLGEFAGFAGFLFGRPRASIPRCSTARRRYSPRRSRSSRASSPTRPSRSRPVSVAWRSGSS